VDLPLTTSIIVGSVPAVLVGSLLSSRVKDKYVRPAITVVILASGLKYVGLGTRPLAWAVSIAVAAILLNWLFRATPWRRSSSVSVPVATDPTTGPEPQSPAPVSRALRSPSRWPEGRPKTVRHGRRA